MSRGLQGAIMRGFGARDHQATVLSTESVTPHYLRIRFHCPTVFDDLVVSPTAWLRFWFPDPDGGADEYQRGYTLRTADPEQGEFTVEFVLHEPAGPASTWAETARPGDTIAAMAMGSYTFEVPEELPAGYLLVGDAASLPAINSILEVLPAEVPVELYLEQHTSGDLDLELVPHPRLRSRWVARGDGTALAAALEVRDWSDWTAWVSAESGTLKQVRARLREEFGFPKPEIYGRAYWIHGRSMGKVRDGQEHAASITPEPAAEAVAAAPDPPAPPAPPAGSSSWQTQAAGRLLAPLRPTLIAAGVLQGLVSLLQLTPYVLLAELARRLLAGSGSGGLWQVGIAALVLLGISTMLGAALLFWLHLVDARFETTLRRSLLDKLSRLPLGWFTDRGSGAIKKLVTDDTLSLHYLITHAVPDAVAAVVAPIAVLLYLFFVDWRLALVMLVPLLIYLVTMWIMIVRSGPKVQQAPRWAERMSGLASGYLEGQPVVRIFGGSAASGFRRELSDYLEFLNGWQRPFIGKKTVMDLVTRPATFGWLIVAVGTGLIIAGTMAPASILPFLFLGTTFGARLLGISYGLGGIRDGMLAARRLQVALDTPELASHDAGRGTVRPPGSTEIAVGRVQFDEVGFGYRTGVPVINGVSFDLEPGTVTALVGPSGSGKSTLAGLLARFHDVSSGAIRIDGHDIAALTADELYARVGFVFQDPQLVQGSVHDNIALAVPGADREQVEFAARQAQLHERIMRLPAGYDTKLVGGAGLNGAAGLSGGERQRLSIARALLADPPVLVLDEATAFADPESEFLVQQAISRLTEHRTVLVIAHRLHTVTGADQIIVLDNGRIAEQGRHSELLARSGRYRELWDAQGGASARLAPRQEASA